MRKIQLGKSKLASLYCNVGVPQEVFETLKSILVFTPLSFQPSEASCSTEIELEREDIRKMLCDHTLPVANHSLVPTIRGDVVLSLTQALPACITFTMTVARHVVGAINITIMTVIMRQAFLTVCVLIEPLVTIASKLGVIV